MSLSAQMLRAEFGVNNMEAWIHPTSYQCFRLLLMVSWGAHFGSILGLLGPIEDHLNVAAYLSLIADLTVTTWLLPAG